MTSILVGLRERRIKDLSLGSRFGLIAAGCVLAGFAVSAAQDDTRREVKVSARDGAFHPARVEVRRDDLVKVTFTAEDGPHTFNVDAYRIAKRARPGYPAVFEFRADQSGTFTYYCNLSESRAPHHMRGEFIVRER
jgi:plastocyanin